MQIYCYFMFIRLLVFNIERLPAFSRICPPAYSRTFLFTAKHTVNTGLIVNIDQIESQVEFQFPSAR